MSKKTTFGEQNDILKDGDSVGVEEEATPMEEAKALRCKSKCGLKRT